MRSDARKRLIENHDSHRLHPDAAVCALIERERRKAAADAWDEGAKSAHLHETEHWVGIKHGPNPYRIESA